MCGLALGQTCDDHKPKRLAASEGIPESILRAPIAMQSGIGNSHEKVSTSSPRAQQYYDQGLSYLYSYDWIHAARSFNQALRWDPKLAMANLGLSYAYSGFGDSLWAREMADRAEQLSSGATAQERLRVELRAKQLLAMQASAQDRDNAYRLFVMALDKALARDGNNVHLLLIRGIAAEGYAGSIGQHGQEESMGYYRKVLKLDPRNTAAHHFLVHANEMMNRVAEALHHSEIYQKLAPSVAHAHHMFGHDLRRTDRVREAIVQFTKADELARASYKSEPETLLYDWNYRHNLNLLATTYAQMGLSVAALAAFERLAELHSITPADDFYKAQLAAFLVREGRSRKAIIAASRLDASEFAVGRVLAHSLAGSAYARQKNAQEASVQLSFAEKEVEGLDPVWHAQLGATMEILRAQIDFLQGRRERAAARLRIHVREIRALPSSDAWSETMFQLQFMGEIAIESGDWDLARFMAQQLSDHAPFYVGAHKLSALLARHKYDAFAKEHKY